jgi:hypothetical protein
MRPPQGCRCASIPPRALRRWVSRSGSGYAESVVSRTQSGKPQVAVYRNPSQGAMRHRSTWTPGTGAAFCPQISMVMASWAWQSKMRGPWASCSLRLMVAGAAHSLWCRQAHHARYSQGYRRSVTSWLQRTSTTMGAWTSLLSTPATRRPWSCKVRSDDRALCCQRNIHESPWMWMAAVLRMSSFSAPSRAGAAWRVVQVRPPQARLRSADRNYLQASQAVSYGLLTRDGDLGFRWFAALVVPGPLEGGRESNGVLRGAALARRSD